MAAPRWLRQFNWYLRGHRPTRLRQFGALVVQEARRWNPDLLLATGIAPLERPALARLCADKIPAVNFLTDDPWNPAHRAPWFIQSLREYATVMSPRRSNLMELSRAGCKKAIYLPFAYDPFLHFIEVDHCPTPSDPDVVFVGGADRDRKPYFVALAGEGIHLAIYGDYWDRIRELKPFWRGYADPMTLRRISRRARICLCLVRQANRDGHTMRSFEAAAMGGCLLVEETPEHQEIFGPDGVAVVYFRSICQMQERVRWLLDHDAERRRLARAAHFRITQGGNTYADRLEKILHEMHPGLRGA